MYDKNKLTELVLYIGDRCALDTHYGVLKLNKILFYSDFRAHRRLGHPITGAQYRKYPHGPAPAVMKMLRKELEASKDAVEYHRHFQSWNDDGEGIVEKRLLPRRKADLDQFSAAEIALVEQVIDQLRPMTGTAVSKMSHKHPGWRLTAMGDDIPYGAALLPEAGTMPPLTAADHQRAKEVAVNYTAGGLSTRRLSCSGMRAQICSG